MSQEYSNPKRADDPHALPDVEIYHWTDAEAEEYYPRDDGEPSTGGYFYWYCFPGCLPDSDPFGPFDTYAEAFAAMRNECDDDLGPAEDET